MLNSEELNYRAEFSHNQPPEAQDPQVTDYRGFAITYQPRVGHYLVYELERSFLNLAAAKARIDRELR